MASQGTMVKQTTSTHPCDPVTSCSYPFNWPAALLTTTVWMAAAAARSGAEEGNMELGTSPTPQQTIRSVTLPFPFPIHTHLFLFTHSFPGSPFTNSIPSHPVLSITPPCACLFWVICQHHWGSITKEVPSKQVLPDWLPCPSLSTVFCCWRT